MNISQEVKEEVSQLIAKTLRVNINTILGVSKIGDFQEWDSVGQLAILSSIEEFYNIHFDPEDLMEMVTVDDIIMRVCHKIS